MNKYGMIRRYADSITVINRALDIVICAFSAVLAYQLRFGFFSVQHLSSQYQVLILIGLLLVALVFPAFGIYGSWRARSFLVPIVRVIGACFIVMLLLMSMLVFAKRAESFSRIWLVSWMCFSVIFIIGAKLLTYGILALLRRHGYNHRYVVLIGNDKQCKFLSEEIKRAPWLGLKVVATFRNNFGPKNTVEQSSLAAERLRHFVKSQLVDEVWVTIPLGQSNSLYTILDCLENSTANIRYLPDFYGLMLLNHGVTEILGLPMLDLSTSPMQGLNLLVKSIEDKILALIILLLASPVMVAIAFVIKLTSPGPVLFRQLRNGWDQREIWVYKFRTMKQHLQEPGVVVQACRNDPRLTRFGSFLRRASLDELPQFFNVIKGEMSIVGPRPHAIEHNEQYKDLIKRYALRNKVKPGITGWAQVNGWRGQTDTVEKMSKRVEYDLYYIEHWSLWFDLKIIVLTLLHGFVNDSAY